MRPHDATRPPAHHAGRRPRSPQREALAGQGAGVPWNPGTPGPQGGRPLGPSWKGGAIVATCPHEAHGRLKALRSPAQGARLPNSARGASTLPRLPGWRLRVCVEGEAVSPRWDLVLEMDNGDDCTMLLNAMNYTLKMVKMGKKERKGKRKGKGEGEEKRRGKCCLYIQKALPFRVGWFIQQASRADAWSLENALPRTGPEQ